MLCPQILSLHILSSSPCLDSYKHQFPLTKSLPSFCQHLQTSFVITAFNKQTFPGPLLCTRHSSGRGDPEETVTCSFPSNSLQSSGEGFQTPKSCLCPMMGLAGAQGMGREHRESRWQGGRQANSGEVGKPRKYRALWLGSES